MTTQGFTSGSVTQKLIDVNSSNVKLKYDIIMHSVITEKTDQTSRYLTNTEYGSFDELESELKKSIEIIFDSYINKKHIHDPKRIESLKTVSKQIRDVLNFITYGVCSQVSDMPSYPPQPEKDYIDNLGSNGIKINDYLEILKAKLKEESKRPPKSYQTQSEDIDDFRKTMRELVGITVNFGLFHDEFHICRIIHNKSGYNIMSII